MFFFGVVDFRDVGRGRCQSPRHKAPPPLKSDAEPISFTPKRLPWAEPDGSDVEDPVTGEFAPVKQPSITRTPPPRTPRTPTSRKRVRPRSQKTFGQKTARQLWFGDDKDDASRNKSLTASEVSAILNRKPQRATRIEELVTEYRAKFEDDSASGVLLLGGDAKVVAFAPFFDASNDPPDGHAVYCSCAGDFAKCVDNAANYAGGDSVETNTVSVK